MKTHIKKSIVPLLASQPVSALANLVLGKGIAIFMLHRFARDGLNDSGHRPSILRRYLHYLRNNGYHFVSLDTIINAVQGRTTLPDKAVAFTMDDGFYDQAEIGSSIFLEFDCPVTIFLISGMLDGDLWPWDDQVVHLLRNTKRNNIKLSFKGKLRAFQLDNPQNKSNAIHLIQNWIKGLDGNLVGEYISALSSATGIELPEAPPESWRPMTWEMARDLEKEGIQFAPHTISHRILSSLDAEASLREITGSWKRLNDELVSPLKIFCYPTGRSSDFGGREIALLQEAGFRGAVSTEPTFVNLGRSDPNYIYSLPRFRMPDSLTDFIQYSSWIERAKSALLRR